MFLFHIVKCLILRLKSTEYQTTSNDGRLLLKAGTGNIAGESWGMPGNHEELRGMSGNHGE